ncbi:hypothetical protein AURANDRAFT_69090, partial [Aureococcus anophagefferens]
RSKQLAHLLYRLESALKEHFQLREMEVPTSEERLRWSLNRFLAAAAKKQFPARIVIVLDAVNRLRGESSAADTLHWLPTELPQGVRIIVSTVELEQSNLLSEDLYDEGSRIHRTYTELRRRKCPTIRLQPLSVEVRHLIIGSFLKVNQQALQSLEQAQQFRLVTAKASSQPLFLRTILYALRLGFEMSDAPIDQQIDSCLAAETSSELIACVLEMCSEYVDSTCTTVDTSMSPAPVSKSTELEAREIVPNILARVLTALYASRHGLSDMEMWGIVELATGDTLPSEQRECIRRVLRDFTFSVNGLRNFSHEDYAAVVYNEYIRVPEVHVRAHQLMARYFGKLPPCDRKLDALPYHLEVSGSWPRLRAALVDVQMFRLWWTPAHKTEFLNLWASLTACSNPGAPIRKLVTGEFDDTMRCTQPPRPCLDIVEEYVRSVDEYKFTHSPSDDELATVILRIADFMLEFATLSLEEAADVPQFIHPSIPNDDLAREKGAVSGKPSAVDVPMKGSGRNQYRGPRSELGSDCNEQGNISSNAADRPSGIISDLANNWESHAELIRKRTFITDVKEFFFKFYNAQTLQTQMRALHNAAETRQRELKKVLTHVEAELEQTRLGTQLGRHKHARETALAAERLRQAAFGGVKHVCTTLGIPPPDQDTPVNEIIHQVESVLEALMEEKDKTAQKMGDPHQPTFRDTTPGYDKLMRAPELDAALEQFETPKALIAHRLPAKAPDESRAMHDEMDLDINADEGGIKCRNEVKREAQKSLRAEQRRLARLSPQ